VKHTVHNRNRLNSAINGRMKLNGENKKMKKPGVWQDVPCSDCKKFLMESDSDDKLKPDDKNRAR
jgi:hypothetical protein